MGVGNALIVTVCVAVSPQVPEKIWVTVNVPAPETAGSNVPTLVFVIPVPLQTPPAVTGVKLKAASLIQCAGSALMVASGGKLKTCMMDVSIAGQGTVRL